MAVTKRSVIMMLIALIVVHASNDPQKWRGLFYGPFVLQVFAAHLTAIDSSVQVPNLHNKPSTKAGTKAGTKGPTKAVGALGLPTASVCTSYRAGRISLIINRWSGCVL